MSYWMRPPKQPLRNNQIASPSIDGQKTRRTRSPSEWISMTNVYIMSGTLTDILIELFALGYIQTRGKETAYLGLQQVLGSYKSRRRCVA